MKDLLANPDVAKLIRMWRRHSRGARLVQEYFEFNEAAVVDFLNSFLTPHDLARDLAHEPPQVQREVLMYVATRYGPASGDC